MKNWVCFTWCCLLSLAAVVLHAQVGQGQPAPSTNAVQILELGPHHRVCRAVTLQTNELGVTSRTNQWTELETGMNVQGEDGRWSAASTGIEPANGGAIAQKGQTKVVFAANLNSLDAVDVTASDGVRLLTNIRGLGYFDSSTGQRVVIAPIKDSYGQILTSKNQVFYPDAFTNCVKAGVLYNYTKAGLQQCVLLQAQLPVSPAES